MKKMFICNNVENNEVLRVRFLKLNVYSSWFPRNPGFLDQLIVSDEAIFSLNSEINTRNVRKYTAHGDGHPATNPEPQQRCFSKF